MDVKRTIEILRGDTQESGSHALQPPRRFSPLKRFLLNCALAQSSAAVAYIPD